MTDTEHDAAQASRNSPRNENGVYTEYETEIVARHNRAYASIDIARCEDGRYRFSVGVSYSYGGFSGPITDRGDGFEQIDDARRAAISELLKRFPMPWPSDPYSVQMELEAMRKQIVDLVRQPTLF